MKRFAPFLIASLPLLGGCFYDKPDTPDTAAVIKQAARDAFEAKCIGQTSGIKGLEAFKSVDLKQRLIDVNGEKVGEVRLSRGSYEGSSFWNSNTDDDKRLSDAQGHAVEYAVDVCAGLAGSPNFDPSATYSVPVLPSYKQSLQPAPRLGIGGQ